MERLGPATPGHWPHGEAIARLEDIVQSGLPGEPINSNPEPMESGDEPVEMDNGMTESGADYPAYRAEPPEGEDTVSDTYLRQSSLGLVVPKTVAVVGVGGVGVWVAYFLALAGVEELWLFDGDTVSSHNLNRLPYHPAAVGMNKAEAAKQYVRQCRPECRVLSFGAWTPELAESLGMAEGDTGVEWVIATTDSHASREAVYHWTSNNIYHRHYLEASAEGEVGGATNTPADWATEEELQPGYRSVPVWVGPCVAAAMAVVAHLLHPDEDGERGYNDFNIRLGWMGDRYGAQLRYDE